MDTQLLLTVREVAQRLSMGRTVVYQLLMRGEIESVKVGRARRVPVAAVQAYVERLREKATEQRDTVS